MTDGVKLGQQAVTIPSGTVATRPASPQVGDTRWNTELVQTELWNGSAWIVLGNTGGAFFMNNKTIAGNITIPATQNAMSAGPITINNGITVTVADGATWTVV